MNRLITQCQIISQSWHFQRLIIGAIMLSVFLVGLETYPTVADRFGSWLDALELAVIGLFVVELAIRITAYAPQPWRFFQDGWNVLDFIIVAVCFIPNAQYAAVLRLLRILRVLRLLRLVAQARQAEIERDKNRQLSAAHESLQTTHQALAAAHQELAIVHRELETAHQQLETAYAELHQEKQRSEGLLLNILPHLIAQRLKTKPDYIADSFPSATVMFADIVGFTRLSATISAEALVQLLDGVFSRFDGLVEHYDLEKIKTIGDAYMVVGGVPKERDDHLQAMAHMALDMIDEVEDFARSEGIDLAIRIGIHSGPVVAGVIGHKKFIYDLWGDTVNVASRMESHGIPGKVQLTKDTAQQLGDDFELTERGTVEVKGKGLVTTCFLVGRAPTNPVATTEVHS